MAPSRTPLAVRHTAVAAVFLLASPAAALDPAKAIGQYVHEVWQAEQGLPQNTVAAIAQTPDGYLWLGTQEGLVRFDGVRFILFDRRNTPELPRKNIKCLLTDRGGRLWVGTAGPGLVRLDAGGFRQYGAAEGLPQDPVAALIEDKRGRVWVGTLGGGVVRLDGERFVKEPALEKVVDTTQALFEDHAGALWIGTQHGLVRWETGTATTYTTSDGLVNNDVRSLGEDGEGNLWIGTRGGLNQMKDGQFVDSAADGVRSNYVWSIRGDRDGNLWMGTYTRGLLRLSRGGFTSFTTKDGLSTDNVRSLLEDREGNVWVGTEAGGLNRLTDGAFTSITAQDGLSHDAATSVYEDGAGAIWIGTVRGLNRLEAGKLTSFTQKEGLPNDGIASLVEDSEKRLWIGTGGGGLVQFQRGRFTALSSPQGPSKSSFVLALFLDHSGNLWSGTQQDVYRSRDGHWTSFTTNDGLPRGSVRAILETRNGVLWVGTSRGGLARFDGNRFVAVGATDGFAKEPIQALHEDAEGGLWIGTSGGGLRRLRDGRVAVFTTQQGLHDDTIHRILEDGRGNLWMSTNKGVFRVSKRDLEEVAAGSKSSVESVAYGTSDGMKAAECNGGDQPAGWKARDGRLWFPTIRGIVVVDPEHLPSNSVPPPVHVEEVMVDQRLAPSAPLRLRPGQHAVEIHYTALSFKAPSRVRFKYKLEGFDADWIDAGVRRTAYYTNVPHGKYRFRVIASNSDGIWNEQGATLPLTIDPHLYQTSWFRFVTALGLGVALVGAYRVRLWQLRARERELLAEVDERTRRLREQKEHTEAALRETEQARREAEQHEAEAKAQREVAEVQRARAEEANRAKTVFLANMSHELRTPLNGILGFAQLMVRRPGRDSEDHQSLATILKSGEHLLGLINDVLSLSKMEAGRLDLNEVAFDLAAMLRGLEEMLSARAEVTDLALTLELAPGCPPAVMGDEGKLRQVLINLLGNAMKFTKEGGVKLQARWSDGRAIFEVEDTGPGITPTELTKLFEPFVQTETGQKAKEGTGLGLAISRSMARAMGGDITVTSELGRGSTFRVEVSLPAAPAGTIVETHRGPRRVVGLAPGQAVHRVLVVDDVLDNRVLLARLLASVGFAVKEASDGAEAVEVWRTWRPHIVWMDKRMPGVDGLEATRRIRKEERATKRERCVIIALSASALQHERGEILDSGCDDFVAKPFREETIFGVIAERLGALYTYEDFAPGTASPDAVRLLSKDRLAALPLELIAELQRALTAGDTLLAGELATHIAPRDPEVSRELQTMIREFRLDELENLLAAVTGGVPPGAQTRPAS